MNMLTHNPDFALEIARRTIDDRIEDAQQRTRARAARAERRSARRASRNAAATPERRTPLSLAVLRLIRPARGAN